MCVLVSISSLGFSDHIDRGDSEHEGFEVPVARVADAPQMRVICVDTRFEGSAPAHSPMHSLMLWYTVYLWGYFL